MARISICLPVYNGAEHVEAALESIAAQTSDEYIVLASNNASTDQTAEVLERWKNRIPMTVFTQPETIPMTAHFDTLLGRVETDYYMLLCHDDFFSSPNSIARALETIDAQPHVSAIYCDLAYVSEKGRVLAHRRFGKSGEFSADAAGRETLRTARNMFGIPLLVRRDALGANRYDHQFGYVLDVDLSWTISKTAPAWHIPEVLLTNRYRSGNSTWGLLANAEKEFLQLAGKHGIELSSADRFRLKLTNAFVAQKKRLFGLYERAVTRFG